MLARYQAKYEVLADALKALDHITEVFIQEEIDAGN
jgi:hypothetical protein